MIKESPLMPVRRLHNYVYCRRLFFLQWVENIFVESADTAEGSHLHRNTDKPSRNFDELNLDEGTTLRSVALESESLGLAGVIDLIEDNKFGREVVDYKKGSSHRDANGMAVARQNYAIQMGAYVLLLRDSGVCVDRASIYYAAERKRVPVILSVELFERVHSLLKEARALAESSVCPPPLQNDPRCLHCSAYPVCLPGESALWSGTVDNVDITKQPPRPSGDDGEVVVVQKAGAYVGCRGGEIHVRIDSKVVSKHPIHQIQAVYLYGGIQCSAQAVIALMERGIPLAYFSPAGRFLGIAAGLPQSGVDARLGQAAMFKQPERRLILAREMVRAKIHNQRVLLMRNGDAPGATLRQLANARDAAATATKIQSLRGIEGSAAALYFGTFKSMLKGTDGEEFDFTGRNRRPPRDPLNALLSQGYSILAKELTGICHAVGLDPFIGVYHQPRFGRPALALDLMEEFRPLIADSVALMLFNRRELDRADFVFTARGVFLSDQGRKQFWRAWFRRLDTEVKHPQFGYRMSYRRMMDVQARQLWRFFRGEASAYHGFTTR